MGVLEDRFLQAWEAEFGVPFDGMRAFIDEIQEISVARREAVASMSRSGLVSLFAKAAGISIELASGTLSMLTLEPRGQWTVAPAGFKDGDWQPWRFGRRLCVLRRPFLQVDTADDPEILFAPGLVLDAFAATATWFHEGSIDSSEVRSRDMARWIGHISRENGAAFTKAVEDRLNGLGWRTRRETTLTKLLAPGNDDRFGDLKRFGDVDVLAWRDGSPRVLAIECKDVQFRKTFGEVAEQLADFRGVLKPNGKPDLLRRHLDRIDVLSAYADAVAKKLGLNAPASIEGHLVFKNPVPMRYAWDHMASRIRLSIFAELDRV